MNIEQEIAAIKQNPAVQQALCLLRTQLPPTLLYHAYPHTEDVLGEVLKLAVMDRLPSRDVELLAVAAAWHDVGFIWSSRNNEPLAADAAQRYLSTTREYTADEIQLIARMILDTALVTEGGSLKQVASHPLSCYLLDADLANFGRDDFFDKSDLQRREIGDDIESFRRKTLALVRNHTWLTPAANAMWRAKRDANLAELERLVFGR